MERRVIEIDQESCDGCGSCVAACEEGAIGMINGKARLLRDDYCDGLGNCIPACPRQAIHFIIREAAPFDDAAIKRRMLERSGRAASGRKRSAQPEPAQAPAGAPAKPEPGNWPVKIALVSSADAVFDGASVLVAADCAAYARPGFQKEYMDGRVRLIGCPKLDDANYEAKLADIFRSHDMKSIMVARMDLPCCEPLARAVRAAAEKSGKTIPVREVVIGTNGEVSE